MAKKKVLDSLKEAIGLTEVFETNVETLKQICIDAMSCKCIAFENKGGKLIRHYPPTLTADQIKEAEKGGSIKIVPFK